MRRRRQKRKRKRNQGRWKNGKFEMKRKKWQSQKRK